MKISIIFTIFLFLFACSKNHDSSTRAVNSTTGGATGGGSSGGNNDTPTLGSVIADGANPDFRPYMGYGGDANSYTLGNDSYITILDNNSSVSSISRFSSSALDTGFGKIDLESGALPVANHMIVYSTMCNGNIYALAWHPAFSPQLFKATPGAGALNFTDITSDYVTLLGGDLPDSYYEITCTKDHVVIPMVRASAPQYGAIMAINTTTDNLSVFLDPARTEMIIPMFYYTYNNEVFFLDSSSRKKMTVNEGTKTVSFSDQVSLNLWSLFSSAKLFTLDSGKVRFYGSHYSTPAYLRYADFDLNVLHDHFTNNDLVAADFDVYDFPSPDSAAADYSRACFSANGKFAANLTTSSSATGLGIYDFTASTPTIYSKFNSGALKVLTAGPFSGSGSYNASVVCNGQNMFLIYSDQGKVVFDQYKVPTSP